MRAWPCPVFVKTRCDAWPLYCRWTRRPRRLAWTRPFLSGVCGRRWSTSSTLPRAQVLQVEVLLVCCPSGREEWTGQAVDHSESRATCSLSFILSLINFCFSFQGVRGPSLWTETATSTADDDMHYVSEKETAWNRRHGTTERVVHQDADGQQ